MTVVNQTPLLRTVNDDPAVLGELLDKLSWAGVTPYYVFQNRPVAGNASFVVPLAEAYDIVEVLAVTDGKIYLKYHQARHPEDSGRFMVYDLPQGASWFDDLLCAADDKARA